MAAKQASVPASASPLDDTERARLAELEQAVERGLDTFREVAEALLEIRSRKLYREQHQTWEAYVRSRWGFSDRRARQLMSAAEIGTVVPVENEAQARELAPLRDDPERLESVYEKAKERAGGAPTAAQLRAAVADDRAPLEPVESPVMELENPTIVQERRLAEPGRAERVRAAILELIESRDLPEGVMFSDCGIWQDIEHELPPASGLRFRDIEQAADFWDRKSQEYDDQSDEAVLAIDIQVFGLDIYPQRLPDNCRRSFLDDVAAQLDRIEKRFADEIAEARKALAEKLERERT